MFRKARDRKINKALKASITVLFLIGLAIVANSHLRKTSSLYNLFLSPSDLYVPLAISEIVVSKKGFKISKEFLNKYPGNHTIGIFVSNPTSVGENYEMGFSVKIEIDENGVNRMNRVVTEPYFPFWGVKTNSGIALLHYRVPKDLPLNKELNAIVTIELADSDFESKYGNTRLYIKKMSDE